jgi:hypothetical protein
MGREFVRKPGARVETTAAVSLGGLGSRVHVGVRGVRADGGGAFVARVDDPTDPEPPFRRAFGCPIIPRQSLADHESRFPSAEHEEGEQ